MSEGTHPFLYLGEVTRRDDPDGLGRVRVLIPGVVEPETRWAFPMGAPGAGTAKRGHFEPPAVGSNVMVLFHLGDVDHPYYLTGPWGDPQGVSDVPEGGEVEGDDRQLAATEDQEWLITRDSRSGNDQKVYRVEHKTSNAKVEIDANPTAIKITLDTGAGPALTLDVSGPSVLLALGGGPQLELFPGGFALSAGSSPEFAGEGGLAFCGARGSTEALVHGTAYRSAETAFLATLLAGLKAFTLATKAAVVEPTLGPASTALDAILATAQGDAFVTDPSAHLSTKVFTE